MALVIVFFVVFSLQIRRLLFPLGVLHPFSVACIEANRAVLLTCRCISQWQQPKQFVFVFFPCSFFHFHISFLFYISFSFPFSFFLFPFFFFFSKHCRVRRCETLAHPHEWRPSEPSMLMPFRIFRLRPASFGMRSSIFKLRSLRLKLRFASFGMRSSRFKLRSSVFKPSVLSLNPN